MHVTRPKSSKGRSRPALNHTKSADISAYRDPPVTPRPPSERAARSARPARVHAFLRQSSAVSAQEAAALLQEAPAPPTISLNRYRVLPSIERRGSGDQEPFRGLEEKTSKLSLSDDLVVNSRRGHQGQHPSSSRAPAASRSNPEMGGERKPEPGQGTPRASDWRAGAEAGSPRTAPPADRPNLLLAVRSPCGKRLQCHFLPTDTLLAVLAAAEDALGVRYGRAAVHTAEVPSRSFTDLSMTLEQCGILNRSVLCISTEDDGSGSTDST